MIYRDEFSATACLDADEGGYLVDLSCLSRNTFGRYCFDVPGQNKRVRRTVIIGAIDQITRPQTERWLSNFVEEQESMPPAILPAPNRQSLRSSIHYGANHDIFSAEQILASQPYAYSYRSAMTGSTFVACLAGT